MMTQDRRDQERQQRPHPLPRSSVSGRGGSSPSTGVNQVGGLRYLWDWIVSVPIDSTDPQKEETVRLGRLFNTLLVFSFLIMLALILILWIMMEQGFFTEVQGALRVFAFPAAFVPFILLCVFMSKRGVIAPALRVYIVFGYLGVMAAVALFGGHRSPAWLLFFWPVTVAGMLWDKKYALLLAASAVVYYGVLHGLSEGLGWSAPFPVDLRTYRFLSTAFGLLMLFFNGGVVTYLNMHSLQIMVARLRGTTEQLEETRANLEDRIASRTQELQRRARQFQAIAELGQITTALTDLGDLLDTGARFVAKRFGFDHTGIYLMDESNQDGNGDGEWLTLYAASSEGGQRMVARGYRVPVEEGGGVGYVSRTGRQRVVRDVAEDLLWLTQPDLSETRSALALPLDVKGHILGVLDIQSVEPDAFSEEDVDVLQVLADNLAVAIESAVLLDETQQTVERLRRYQEAETLNAWRQALARRNMQLDYLYVGGDIRSVEGESILSPASAETKQGTSVGAEGEKFHELAVPIQIQDHTVGVLTFESARPWRQDEIRLAENVVQQLALALQNARLLEETRTRALQERSRSEIVSQLRALNSMDAILRSAVQQLGRALKVERSRIQIAPQEAFVAPAAPRDPTVIPEIESDIENGVEVEGREEELPLGDIGDGDKEYPPATSLAQDKRELEEEGR